MKKINELLHYTAVRFFGALAALLTPVYAFAASNDTLQGIVGNAGMFINAILLPFLYSLALLFFIINVVRYFIIGGANKEDREKAKQSALYGIAAFVFLITIWGIVNIFVEGANIERDVPITPDYISEGS